MIMIMIMIIVIVRRKEEVVEIGSCWYTLGIIEELKKKTRFEILLSAMHCCRLLDKNSVILFNQFRENSRYAIHILLS